MGQLIVCDSEYARLEGTEIVNIILCTKYLLTIIIRSRSCNIRMNIDQVADQHAWITVDSKNQVFFENIYSIKNSK